MSRATTARRSSILALLIWRSPWRRSIAATAGQRRPSHPRRPSAAAAATTGFTSSGWFARITIRSMALSTVSVAIPIGTCQGLNSPHSPRIVMRVRNGNRQVLTSESMLMQLPTPLDCMRRTPLSPPSQAPARIAMPSSSVVSGIAVNAGSAWALRIRSMWPLSGT